LDAGSGDPAAERAAEPTAAAIVDGAHDAVARFAATTAAGYVFGHRSSAAAAAAAAAAATTIVAAAAAAAAAAAIRGPWHQEESRRDDR